jgi:hypothetical protein
MMQEKRFTLWHVIAGIGGTFAVAMILTSGVLTTLNDGVRLAIEKSEQDAATCQQLLELAKEGRLQVAPSIPPPEPPPEEQ